MKKYQSYSILKEITDEIFSSNNFKQSKENILKFVTSKNIDSKDKFKMIEDINKCCSLIKLQQYVANSLLRFEGLSLNSYNK